MNKLIKLLRLSKYEQRLLIQTYTLLTLVRLGLFLLPFKTLKNLLAKVSNYRKPSKSQVTARNIAKAVNRSSRFSPGIVKCLAKALTTNTLMNFHHLDSQLRIGVAKSQNNNLEAHAWVEAEGKIVIGYLPDLARYQTMTSSQEGLSS